MSEFFTFANDDVRTAPPKEDVWPTDKLEAHFKALQETESASYISEERRSQITRRMCHVAFEGLMRSREKNQREQEVAMLEEKMGTFAIPETSFNIPRPKLPWRKQGE